MTLYTRILRYLDNNASQWVPTNLIYSLARRHGFQHDDIRAALSEVAHTPPYACISVQSADVQRLSYPGIVSAGVYYKKHILICMNHMKNT